MTYIVKKWPLTSTLNFIKCWLHSTVNTTTIRSLKFCVTPVLHSERAMPFAKGGGGERGRRVVRGHKETGQVEKSHHRMRSSRCCCTAFVHAVWTVRCVATLLASWAQVKEWTTDLTKLTITQKCWRWKFSHTLHVTTRIVWNCLAYLHFFFSHRLLYNHTAKISTELGMPEDERKRDVVIQRRQKTASIFPRFFAFFHCKVSLHPFFEKEKPSFPHITFLVFVEIFLKNLLRLSSRVCPWQARCVASESNLPAPSFGDIYSPAQLFLIC